LLRAGCGASANNVQIFKHANFGAVVDESEVQGVAGDAAIQCQARQFMRNWKSLSGCKISKSGWGAD